MENHQRSKKHKENIEALKATMTAEDAMYFQKEIIDPSVRKYHTTTVSLFWK